MNGGKAPFLASPSGQEPTGPKILVRFDQVAKRFGSVPAVADVSLDIARGEFFCLLGPSGCGKSTLLRLLAGFERPDWGRILFDGQDVTDEPPHLRPLNMMFQSYALFPHLTVAGNIGYGLRWSRLPKAETAARVEEMLELVRLTGLGGRYPAQISGGQRQRVALARALARRPRALLLDEPMAALDRRLREDTQAELKGLQARLGTTFVMVTHDQAEAMTLADRVGVMEAGRIVQAGTPRQLYERPATRFVASFLGDVNIIEGRVLGVEAGSLRPATAVSDDPLVAALGRDAPPAPGDAVAVAIRPERMRFVSAGEDSAPNVLAGEIVGCTYLGGATTYGVAIRGGEVVRLLRSNAGPAGEPDAGPVRVAFSPDAAILLA